MPQPGKHPRSPAICLLHPAQVEAASPPGKGQEERVEARIGAGQVAFDTSKDPQLTATQAHEGMLASAARGCLPQRG